MLTQFQKYQIALFNLFLKHIFFVKRQEWDNYLSGSPNAESIPIQWVSLVEPKNAEWSHFIKRKSL